MKFLMQLAETESERRRLENERAERFAAAHGMSVDRATALLARVRKNRWQGEVRS